MATTPIIPWIKCYQFMYKGESHIADIQEVGLGSVSVVSSTYVDLGSVSFSWVYLEMNSAAHELAKWSHSQFCFGSSTVKGVIVKAADPFVQFSFLLQ